MNFFNLSRLLNYKYSLRCCCRSVAKLGLTLRNPTDCSMPSSHILHYLLEFAQTPCLLSQWCYLTISSSAALFSFCIQSFPAQGSFPVTWLFASGGQSVGVPASASALPMDIQDWFPLGLTSLISLQSKALSRVFSSTTVLSQQSDKNRLTQIILLLGDKFSI